MPDSLTTELIHFISQDLLGGDLSDELSPDDDLLGDGLVDSLGMMRIVFHLENQYGVVAPPEDVTIENFRTVAAIGRYAEGRLQQ